MRFWLQKVAYWRTVDRAKVPYERKYSGQVYSVLDHASDTIAARLRSGEPLADAADRRALANLISLPMAEIYHDMYLEVGRVFGRATLRALLSGKTGHQLFETKLPNEWDVWDPLQSQEMSDWVRHVTATRIQGVTGRLAQEIRDLVDKYHIEGWDTARLVRGLRDLYGFSNERAQRIAQTEVNSAQNAASHFAIGKHVDPEIVQKSWLATGDRRVRKSHERANGQARAYEDPFNVGGSELMFPGDTSLGAPGKEIIRCRCVATYRIVRGQQPRPPKPTAPPPVAPPPVAPPPVAPRPRPVAPVPKPKPTPAAPGTKPTRDALRGSPVGTVKVPTSKQPTAERTMLAKKLDSSFDNAPELLQRALNPKGVNELKSVTTTDRTSFYSTDYMAISKNKAGGGGSRLYDTLRHEYGHHFDRSAKWVPYRIGSFEGELTRMGRADGGLGTAINEARMKLDNMARTDPVGWQALKRKIQPQFGDSDRQIMLQDIFGALSYGKIGGGHTYEYYNRRQGADSEIMADLFNIVGSGKGNKQLDVLEEYFPSLLDDFVAILSKAAGLP